MIQVSDAMWVCLMRMMDEGYEIWAEGGVFYWHPYDGKHTFPNAHTVHALYRRGLIEIYETVANEEISWIKYGHFRLSELGKLFIERHWEDWAMKK